MSEDIEFPAWLHEPGLLAAQEMYRRLALLEERVACLETFGVAKPASVEVGPSSSVVIAVPAWGEAYIRRAVDHVIPAVKAAVKEDGEPATIVVHTDAPARFIKLSDELCRIECRPFTHHKEFHKALTAAHLDVIEKAKIGSIVILLNADIVPSIELVTFARRAFNGENRIIASVAPRCLVTNEPPPVGAAAKDLLKWAWRNRHPVTEDLVWGRGKSTLPTMLFFEKGGEVTLHCFHLHPFALLKDERTLKFKGTIDDDVLGNYDERKREICYLTNAEIGFAELSPASLYGTRFKSADLIREEHVINYGRNYIPVHIRNFRHPLRITGDGPVTVHPAVTAIAAKMQQHADRRYGVGRR